MWRIKFHIHTKQQENYGCLHFKNNDQAPFIHAHVLFRNIINITICVELNNILMLDGWWRYSRTTKCNRESKINEAGVEWVEVCALSIGLLFVSSWHTVHHHRRRERRRWAITVDSPPTSPLCIHSSCSRSNRNPSSSLCLFFLLC
jgi:hypothetical protein